MLVKDNLLFLDEDTQAPFAQSNNSDPGLQVRYIIIHYTAGTSALAAINTLRDDQTANRVSAHLVISRTGEVTQLVPFDRRAWHAGVSYWENERDINRFSIGIELDNEGWYRQQDGVWVSSFGAPGQEADLEILTHPKHEKPLGWRKFPLVQWQATLETCRALRAAFAGLEQVLGHEDIHQDKTDPGPAFRLDEFRAALFPERVQPQEGVPALAARVQEFSTIRAAPIYENECRDSNKVIVRYGPPPVLPERHPASPLPVDTRVKVTDKRTDPESGVKWSLVEVKSNLPGFSNVKGWVKTEEIKGNKIKSPAVLYVNTGGIPKRETPRHRARTLEAGIRVRQLETRQGWALVRTADKIISHGYVYAWVRESDITAN
ncbi:MAG TPA: N-acetylmuramoyl-L-alanine amidase [Anaerolineales bacterium]|nr:N-acetylmuramoyl-L-alanine amidase [Anaerolineales bacterium]